MHGYGGSSNSGTVHLCLVRYEDNLAFLDRVGITSAWEWDQDHEPEYEHSDGEAWVHYHTYNCDDVMELFAKLAKDSIEVNSYLSEPHTDARKLEQLDWPLFYGWVEPSERNTNFAARCFTSTEHHPMLLTLPCDSTGDPNVDDWSVREHFLRARHVIKDFAREANQHLRPTLRITGPNVEDHYEGRQYEWYENTEEERRRRRLPETGTRREVWTGPTTKEPSEEIVSHEIVDRVLHGRGRPSAGTSDENFTSAFQQQLARRRARTHQGRA